MSKTEIPSIRFRGFDDAWEQRKAKELFVSTEDKGYPELPVLSATQDRGMIRRDENSINIFHDKKNEAGYKRVLPGQFVIHLRSFQGGFAHSTIEGITSPAYTVFGFSEPEKHDSEYWKYVFTSKSFIRRLETVTYGIRDGRSISYEEFLTLGFVYPSKAEQKAIARYLDKLSDLITLHQRDSIMRFFGAWDNANAWEQRKVTELGKIYIGLVTTMTKHYTDEGTLLIRNSDIKDGKFEFGENPIYLEKDFAQKNESRMHQIGDVITVHTGDVGTSAVITKNEDKSIGFATIVTRPNTKIIDANYLCTFLNTDKHKKWAVSISTGDGRTNYNLGDYYELYVPIPKLDEQKHIATYIQNLSNLITLHQRERKNRLFGGKNVKQYNFSRSVLQLLRAMDTRLQRGGCSQGDYG